MLGPELLAVAADTASRLVPESGATRREAVADGLAVFSRMRCQEPILTFSFDEGAEQIQRSMLQWCTRHFFPSSIDVPAVRGPFAPATSHADGVD